MTRLCSMPMLVFVAAALGLAPTVAAKDPIDRAIYDAMDKEKTTAGRLGALTRLAWGEDTASEALAHRARQRLIEAGQKGMGPITEALLWAQPRRFSDIMLASIEAETRLSSGDSPYTTPAIERCIWFGPPDARRLAMDYMTVRPLPILLLAVIDSAYEYPQMVPVVIDTLALMRDDRARFFLAEQLQEGGPDIRRRAAEALASIGGYGLDYLRAWALSDEPELRPIAIRALLPVAGIGDLSTLYEYISLFSEDDPETLDALRARAALLETALARQDALDSASPGLDE